MADPDAAEDTLATRGHRLLEWLHAISSAADGLALTDAGRQLRAEVDAHTVRLASGPWQRLGDQAPRLVELLQPLARTVLANGGYPDGVFATLRA